MRAAGLACLGGFDCGFNEASTQSDSGSEVRTLGGSEFSMTTPNSAASLFA